MDKKNKSRQQKRQVRRRERRKQKRQEERQQTKSKAIRAKKVPEPQPQASGHLMQRFWERFGFDQVLAKLEQEKYKGLPLASLFLVLLSFGMVNATSDQDLTNKVRVDPLLMAMCGVEVLDKQQLYRVRKRLSSDEYPTFRTCFWLIFDKIVIIMANSTKNLQPWRIFVNWTRM